METFRITDPLTLRVLEFIAGRGRPAWMVGGFVRDRLLGRDAHDLDLVVPEGGIDLARGVAHQFGGAFFVLDQERDVARALLPDERGELSVDVARLRSPELGADLALRDFTINAMASPVDGSLAGGDFGVVDPSGGRGDLARGLVRAVSGQAFVDDPLRTLRAARQAVEFGFRIEEATCDLVRRDAALLAKVAAERVRDELLRIIGAPGAWRHLRLLSELDLLRPVLPEAQALAGVTQSEPHYLDVFDHTRAVLAHLEGILALLEPGRGYAAPAELAAAVAATPGEPLVVAPTWMWDGLAETVMPFAAELRTQLLQPLASGRTRRDLLPWAGLAHDWGKARTRSVGVDWRIHFYDHEHQGALMAEDRLRLLAFATAEAAYVGKMVDLHMRPGNLARHYPPTNRALYRFYRDAETLGPDVMLLCLADKLSTRATHAESEQEFWLHLLDVGRQVLDAYFRAGTRLVSPVPLLNGRVVMAELGLKPGPRVGRLIEGLREAQAVGEVTNADEAREWLHRQRDE